jgi:hypothetical protein
MERTYGVDTLQEGIAQDIKGHGTSRLDPAVHHPITCVGERQVLLLNSKLGVADGECNHWKLVGGRVAWENPTLLTLVVRRIRYGVVYCLAGSISYKSKRGSRAGVESQVRIVFQATKTYSAMAVFPD